MRQWASGHCTTSPDPSSLPLGAVGRTTRDSMELSTDQENLARRPSARPKPKLMLSPKISENPEIGAAADNVTMRLHQPAFRDDDTTLGASAAAAAAPNPAPPCPPAVKEAPSEASTATTVQRSESSQPRTPTTFQNTSSSSPTLVAPLHHSILSTARSTTRIGEPRKTSTSQIPSTLGRPSDSPTLKHSTTSLALMMTKPGAARAMPFEEGGDAVGVQLSPGSVTANGTPDSYPAAGLRVPLQKRRRSEERVDQAIRQDRAPPPQKRSRPASTVTIEYDENGVPRLKHTQTQIQRETILTPVSSAQSPVTPLTASQHISPAVQALVAAIADPASPVIGTSTTPAAQQTKRKDFSLLGAFVDDSSLIITLVSYLDIPSLISWYAIDKKFHWYYNKNYTAFILASVRTWSPGAELIFPWRHYADLCIKDPIKRQKAKSDHLGPDIAQMNLFSRDVPSLRWLQMVVWREGVVKDIFIQLATRALRVPPKTRDAMKRLWFIMDLPLNAHRISCIQSKRYIAPCHLKLATVFFLKLDMFFTDPGYNLFPVNHPAQTVFPNRWANGMPLGSALKEILLAENSLTPLWRVLRGLAPDGAGHGRPIEEIDILKLWMRHKYRGPTQPSNNFNKSKPILGLRLEKFVQTGYQPYFPPKDGSPFRPVPLMTIDLLVMSEAMRRKINAQEKVLEMINYGFSSNGRRARVYTEEQIMRQERAVWNPSEVRIIRRNEERERKAEEARKKKLLELQEAEEGDEEESGEESGEGSEDESEDGSEDDTDTETATAPDANEQPGEVTSTTS
ncbi:unnamed protein product [Cercospora beticola]|nr:unnamed protein product [Cercospora beticola]